MSFFRVLMIFLVCVLTSCSQNHLAPKNPDINKTVVPKGQVELLAHQQIPIDYLHKNPQQKGLIVNHYMGTGKTLLGIGVAESFPELPVLIIAPGFLESQWKNEMVKFGVKNSNRYEFVSYDNAPKVVFGENLTKHLVILDEVHNLVKYMRSLDPRKNEVYSRLYLKLRQAKKIIGLTGTPIYNDESDIAFLINLVSGEDLLPFNQETFRLEFTQVIPQRKFFRGFLTESNFFTQIVLPITSMQLAGAVASTFYPESTGALIASPLIALGVAVFIPVGINFFLDTTTHRLRKIDAEKMAPYLEKYVSYFKFDEKSFKDFPDMKYNVRDTAYNKQQYDFFLRMVEGDLPEKELKRLLSNDNRVVSNNYIKLNSTSIHKNINEVIGAGRDIGNFEFEDSQGQMIEPPKFMAIYNELLKNDEQTVVYSNYYKTGTLAFKEFLTRQNYDEELAVITPDLTVSEVNDIVSKYNTEEIKLLLLHPDVTEGISLKGTQHLHILEPMLNGTVLEQVIGRTRRFQSHNHLPLHKRVVHVNMWKSTSSSWSPTVGNLKRANWYKRYREMNYLSRWGIGITQVDKNYDKKVLNPDELSLLKLNTLNRNFTEIQGVLSKNSIEANYRK